MSKLFTNLSDTACAMYIKDDGAKILSIDKRFKHQTNTVYLTQEEVRQLVVFIEQHQPVGLLHQIALRADLLVNRCEPGDDKMLADLIAEARQEGLIPEVDPT
jgi:hypothetical protein